MESLIGILSAFGLSASAGLNAYIPLLVVALAARFTDFLKLEPPWDILANPWVIGILVVLLIVEEFADKAPAINHVNDLVQTVVRPTAGAIVFAASAGVVSDMNPVLALALGLMMSGSVHTVKSVAVRPAVTATTGGAGNVPVSTFEDIIAGVVSVLAVVVPILFALLVFFLAIWVVWLIWRRANRMRPVT